MGWLNSRPKKHKKDSKPKSRIEMLGEGSFYRKMPDADQRIVGAFVMLGMAESGMNGLAPLSWQEIRAFSQQSTCELDPWESEQISIMSREYVSMYRKATDKKGEPAPYQAPLTREDIIANRNRVSNQFAEMKRRRKKKAP